MFVNQKKCHGMHYFVKDLAYLHFIGDMLVCPVNSIRDLGIIFDDQLRFDKQASAVLHKANYGLL